jgi:hypothetical protein
MPHNNSTPFEIIAAPFSVYVAPYGTVMPVIDAEVDDEDWTLIGTSGPLNYFDDGVTIQHGQSTSTWRALGSRGPRKIFGNEESLIISVKLADCSLEQYALALNGNTVATTAAGTSTAGFKTIGMSRGLYLAQHALLVRGPSPYLDEHFMQYEVPLVANTSESELNYKKSDPAGISLQWTAIEDPEAESESERFGRLVAAHAAATGV